MTSATDVAAADHVLRQPGAAVAGGPRIWPVAALVWGSLCDDDVGRVVLLQ